MPKKGPDINEDPRGRGTAPKGHRPNAVRPEDLDLVPGLRDRLFAQMDESGIPAEGRLAYLSAMTGRAPQTVRRWIQEDDPGLPDLLSFAILCWRFNTDANWFLGLSELKYPLPSFADPGLHPSPDWLDRLTREIAEKGEGCEPYYMPSDEMEPLIPKGALVLIDTSARKLAGNGLYLLDYQGTSMVRSIENRIAEGLVLSCENDKYKEVVLKAPVDFKKLRLTVLGKVAYWTHLTKA